LPKLSVLLLALVLALWSWLLLGTGRLLSLRLQLGTGRLLLAEGAAAASRGRTPCLLLLVVC
jgi:hypothetical protein